MSEGRIKNVALSTITMRPNRMRQLRPAKVDELAESIRERGLLQPIVVRPWGDRYMLVCGVHRRQAVEQLGHETIPAIVLDGLDADAALLAGIDENLVRADLSPAERSLHLAERKRLFEEVHPQTTRGGDRKSAAAKSNRHSDDLIRRFYQGRSREDGQIRAHRSTRD
jgi:ParB/RepB/Spo0J family partition protein